MDQIIDQINSKLHPRLMFQARIIELKKMINEQNSSKVKLEPMLLIVHIP